MRPKITCLALYPANQAHLISPNFSNLICELTEREVDEMASQVTKGNGREEVSI